MLFKVVDTKGSNISDENLDYSEKDSVDHHLYLTLNKQSKHLRLVNASTKTRGQVSGGGAKPYRQKGTGHARQGTRRSPLKVGGGVVFGPSPRLRRHKCPKTVVKQSLLASLNAVEDRFVLDEKSGSAISKTKDFASFLSKAKCDDKSVLLVSTTNDVSMVLAARNLNQLRLSSPQSLLVADILSSDAVVFSAEAFKRFKELVS